MRSAAAIIFSAVLALGGPDARAETWPWQMMRLGGPADAGHPGQQTLQAAPDTDRCRKWQSLVGRLGETFAGYSLRHSVLRKVCGITGAGSASATWDWPWSGLANGRLVPPRPLKRAGAWEIRCGAAQAQRRCALVNGMAEPAAATADEEPLPSVITHFVIDRIGGREVLLWRVFVPDDSGAARRENSLAGPAGVARSSPATTGEVRYSLGGRDNVEPMVLCAVAGCLMEATPRRAGAVATRLWEGHALELAIHRRSPADRLGGARRVMLPPQGFRAAFGDLLRLRRDELRERGQP